jgi:hypothetical protein
MQGPHADVLLKLAGIYTVNQDRTAKDLATQRVGADGQLWALRDELLPQDATDEHYRWVARGEHWTLVDWASKEESE